MRLGKILLFALSSAVLAGAVEAGETTVVIATGYRFEPAEVTIKVGGTVRWENHEKRQYHSVWFKEQGEEPGQYFFPGESMERAFDKPGTFPYVCQPHEHSHHMQGVVHVIE